MINAALRGNSGRIPGWPEMIVCAALPVVQLPLNASAMPGTLRLYGELFSFQNACGDARWENAMRITLADLAQAMPASVTKAS